MDLKTLATGAVLAIHGLLFAFGLRGSRRGHEQRAFLAFSAVATAWCGGRLLERLGVVAGGTLLGLASATIPALAVALLAGRRRLAGAALAAGLGGALLDRESLSPAVGAIGAALEVAALATPALAVLADSGRTARSRPLEAAALVLAAGAAAAFAGMPAVLVDRVPVLAADAVILALLHGRRVDLEPATGTSVVFVIQAVAAVAVVLVGLTITDRFVPLTLRPAHVTALAVLAVAAVALSAAARVWTERWLDRALHPERERLRRLGAELAAEREALRARLARTERLALLGEVAARVAHEIKNPLGPIKGFAQMIAEDVERHDRPLDRDVLGRRVSIIIEEVERIDQRVRGLLGEAREAPEPPCSQSFDAAVERAIALVEGEARDRVRVRARLASSAGGPVLLRPHAFQGALVNVLLNAFEAVEEGGGNVDVETAFLERDGRRWVEVRVIDDGAGIPAERLATVFDPFVSGRHGGIGLGLGIARRAIEADGGGIEIESRAGGGTTVRIRMPVADLAAHRPAEAAAPGRS